MQSAHTYKTNTALAIVKRAGENFAWRALAFYLYGQCECACGIYDLAAATIYQTAGRQQILSVRRV